MVRISNTRTAAFMIRPPWDDGSAHGIGAPVCGCHAAPRRPSAIAVACLLALSPAMAQQAPPAATTLDTVEVLGARHALSDFPGSVTVIDGDTLRDGQRQVSLSEALVRVPGITVLDRQNYAQDLQVQSRGFGARSTFGIRGIKLVVDGIPSSALDGQGQAANFPLGALDRIEVLRGPLALQYGNAAGGAIVGETELDGARGVDVDGWVGSDGSGRVAAGIEGASDGRRLALARAGQPLRDRWRAPAQRGRARAVRCGRAVGAGRRPARCALVPDGLTQPDTQDPLGLTRAQWQRDPHGTDPVALAVRYAQAHRQPPGRRCAGSDAYAPGRESWLGGYGIDARRGAVPGDPDRGAGARRASAGGVIDLGRRSTGVDAGHRWSGAARRAGGRRRGRGGWTKHRRGYENFVGDARQLGVRGRLRRDEDNRIDSREAYVHRRPAAGRPTGRVLGAVRHARLRFASDDHYIAPGNGDDSGALDYSETAASLGVARAFAHGEVFASVGRGFETPTVTELAYRPDGGAGFNLDLQPAHFDTAEVGARWRLGARRRQHRRVSHRRRRRDRAGRQPRRPRQLRQRRAARAATASRLASQARCGQRWSYALAANWLRARFTAAFQLPRRHGGAEQRAHGRGGQPHSRHPARRRLRRAGLERRRLAGSSRRSRRAPATASPPTTATPTPRPATRSSRCGCNGARAAIGLAWLRARRQPVRPRVTPAR